MSLVLRYWPLLSLAGFVVLGTTLLTFNQQLTEEPLFASQEPLLSAIEQTQSKFARILVLGFALLYLLLLIVAKHVENIMTRQRRCLQCSEKAVWEKARQLEQEVTARKQAENALARAQHKPALEVNQRQAELA